MDISTLPLLWYEKWKLFIHLFNHLAESSTYNTTSIVLKLATSQQLFLDNTHTRYPSYKIVQTIEGTIMYMTN